MDSAQDWSFSPLLSYGFQQEQEVWLDDGGPLLASKIQQLQTLLMQIAEQNKADALTERLIDELTVAAKKALCGDGGHIFVDNFGDLDLASMGDDDKCSYPIEGAVEQQQEQQQQEQDRVEQYLQHSLHSSSMDEEEEEEEEERKPEQQQHQHQELGSCISSSPFELLELDEMEILAEHRHFCSVCGKGFRRDANLRMHMRGHGEQYKSMAALCRPPDGVRKRQRYSCPFAGCKRNKLHPRFAPLKTLLCIKNHYRRSHCPKLLICAKCRGKSFSVLADLRTHEKHCGSDTKWSCSCGSTFSRKDKLQGHISLFPGHVPMP